MTDVFKCTVYYSSNGVPFLCYDLDCVDCSHDCFEAVIKIMPIDHDEASGIKDLDELAVAADKVDKNLKKTAKELKKTFERFSKIMNKFK